MGESPLERLRARPGARTRRFLIVGVTALCLLATALAGARYLRPADLATRSVPDVVSLTRAAAEEAIREARLAPAVRLTESSDVRLWDRVLQQSPLPGMRAARGQRVQLLVAARDKEEGGQNETGPLTVYREGMPEEEPVAATPPRRRAQEPAVVTTSIGVPRVTGRSEEEARRLLRAVGLGMTVTGRAFNDSAPRGQVITQSPGLGARPPADETVGVVLSLGRGVTVPRVVGRSRAQAVAALRRAGLRVEVTRRWDQRSAGTVLRVSPRAGVRLAPGARVTLVVSRGPRQAQAATAPYALATFRAAPGNCEVWPYVDGGHARGKCPCTVRLSPGRHTITLWDTTHLKKIEFIVTARAGSAFTVQRQVH